MSTANEPNPEPKGWGIWRWLSIALIALPCCGCPVTCATAPYLRARLNRVPFDSGAWKQKEWPSRFDISWDLLHRDLLIGKTQEEVAEMLGPAEQSETLQRGKMPHYDPGPNEPGTVVWYYLIGFDRYEWISDVDPAMLAVDFRNGRVIRTRKIKA